MCFSAKASFSAAAVLSLMSFMMIARNKKGRFYFLTFIPLFFAIQQFCEGMVWLGKEPFWKDFYLFFAFCFWPVYLPLSLYVADRQKGHLFCLGVGFALAVVLFFTIPLFQVVPYPYSIHYHSPTMGHWVPVSLYLLATVLPFFLSTLKKVWIFGSLALLSAFLVYWIDNTIFISMWCFWAAIISLGLFFILWQHDRVEKDF